MRRKTAVAWWATLVLIGSLAGSFGDPEAWGRTRAPVAVTSQRNLDFADVFPGVNHSITITDLTSGKWLITGDPSTDVDISFPGLPATLSNGGNTIPIAYSATDAGYCTTDDPGSASTFDPSAGTTATLSAGGQLYVWIGGTVQPSEVAVAGTYSATITLESDYH